MTKRALFVGRFQPFHKGHLSAIEKMGEDVDVDELIVAVGSGQFSHTAQNPFTYEERAAMVERSLSTPKRYYPVRVDDLMDYSRWVSHVESLCPEFKYVYTGNKITRRLFEEAGYGVREVPSGVRISATDVRQMIVHDSNWRDFVPSGTAQVIDEIGGVDRIKQYAAKWENPAVTADLIPDDGAGIYLIKRGKEPFLGLWALIGGHYDKNESVRMTAAREGEEETGLIVDPNDLVLLDEYSDPGRDPRGPYVSLAYYTTRWNGMPRAGDDAADLRKFLYAEIPAVMAFDHRRIMNDYFRRTGRPQFVKEVGKNA